PGRSCFGGGGLERVEFLTLPLGASVLLSSLDWLWLLLENCDQVCGNRTYGFRAVLRKPGPRRGRSRGKHDGNDGIFSLGHGSTSTSSLAPYRGWFPVISSLCCSNFVYFYTFNSLKTVWVKGQHSTTGKDLVVGFVAGVVNVLLTTPLWVVNTRLKLQGAKFRNEDIVPTNYSGIIDAFHQIIRDEGISALWNGTFPSLLLVFNPAIQFMFYEGLKRQLLKKRMKLSSLDVFIIGAIAKAIATTVTYPMQTVQSILRFGRHRLNPENRTLGSLRNVLYLLHQRVRRFGIMGLYKGLEAKLLQTVLTAALMFLVYEKLTATTFMVMGLKRASKH
uniref:Solute carrier family 25 member 17 n=2 Tax=Sus scrofa TaxID=9823 RepID=A0A8D1QN75_PIG